MICDVVSTISAIRRLWFCVKTLGQSTAIFGAQTNFCIIQFKLNVMITLRNLLALLIDASFRRLGETFSIFLFHAARDYLK